MIRLGPAGWIDDDGALHLDTVALCREAGEEPTPENQQWWMDEIARQMRQKLPGVTIFVRETDRPDTPMHPFNPLKHLRRRSSN